MIHCPACGTQTAISNIASKGDSAIADALQIVTRTRTCPACATVTHTTEMRTAEMGELRRRAYLWERHEAAKREATHG